MMTRFFGFTHWSGFNHFPNKLGLFLILIFVLIVLTGCAGEVPTQNTDTSVAVAAAPVNTPIPLTYERTSQDVRFKILLHSNEWGDTILYQDAADLWKVSSSVESPRMSIKDEDDFLLTAQAAIEKWDAVYAQVVNSLSPVQHPASLIPQIVKIKRYGPTLINGDSIKDFWEGGSIDVVYDISIAETSEQGFQLVPTVAGDQTYLTILGPQTESGRASLEIDIPTVYIKSVIMDPFLNPQSAPVFPTGTPQYKDPLISQNETDVLMNILGSLGRSSGAVQIGKLTLYPMDSNAHMIQDQFVKLTLQLIDWKTINYGTSVTVSLVGFMDKTTEVKGFITGGGGGANGGISGNLNGGMFQIWPYAAGSVEGNIEGSFQQDPISIDGAISSRDIRTFEIYFYFEQ